MIKAAALVSEGGAKLQALIDCVYFNEIPDFELTVISSNPKAYALTRARNAGLPCYVVEEAIFPNGASFSLALLNKRIKSPFLLAFFNYIPYAVLTALTIPAIFSSTQSLWGAGAGFLAALLLSLKGKPMMTVALGGAGVVWLVEGLLMRLL